jgi:hypothetical protein
VRLYKEHDVLQEVLDQGRRDLKDPKDPKDPDDPKDLPAAPPKQGSLDIEQVLDAE